MRAAIEVDNFMIAPQSNMYIKQHYRAKKKKKRKYCELSEKPTETRISLLPFENVNDTCTVCDAAVTHIQANT